MSAQFYDRVEAGRLLAEKLGRFANRPDVLVIGLPRGGVPVAAQVAQELNAPLEVFIVRKLGTPGQEELAMGAIATGGIRVLNAAVVDSLGISDEVIAAAEARELRELERREHAYRAGRPPADVEGRTVLIVDDGIATGSTMLAAIAALRILKAGRIVAAAPTIAADTFLTIERQVDEIVAVIAPHDFRGVGQWYEHFPQTTDEEVREILAQSDARFRAANP